jgi:hypothetical protein
MPSWRDETLLKKQDGIASFITHCKESIHHGTCPSSSAKFVSISSETA